MIENTWTSLDFLLIQNLLPFFSRVIHLRWAGGEQFLDLTTVIYHDLPRHFFESMGEQLQELCDLCKKSWISCVIHLLSSWLRPQYRQALRRQSTWKKRNPYVMLLRVPRLHRHHSKWTWIELYFRGEKNQQGQKMWSFVPRDREKNFLASRCHCQTLRVAKSFAEGTPSECFWHPLETSSWGRLKEEPLHGDFNTNKKRPWSGSAWTQISESWNHRP